LHFSNEIIKQSSVREFDGKAGEG